MTAASPFLSAIFDAEMVEQGQRELAARTRFIVATREPDTYAMVEHCQDRVFLEPLLFAYAVDPAPRVSVAQILPVVQANLFPIENLHVELAPESHPLLDKFFVTEAGGVAIPDTAGLAARHRQHLAQAFRLIDESVPEYYAQILKVTRRVLLYRGDEPYSFTTLGAHGIVFLNTPPDADEVFFLEDLIHQCGHLLFSALTLDPSELLRISPDTPLSALHGDARDQRDVYTLLHGVFTEAWMNLAFHRCCDSPALSQRQRHELLGRFALILTRFGGDLRSIARNELFTPTGHRLLAWFLDVYRDIVSCRHQQLSPLDLSDQPYCFSYRRFLERNPIERLPPPRPLREQ